MNYPGKNLTGHSVQSTYSNILQIVSGSIIVNGVGDEQINFNTYTSSYSNTSSYTTSNNVSTSNYSLTSSYALYSVTSSNSITSSYATTASTALQLNGVNDYFEKDNSNNVLFTVVNSQSLSLGMGLMVYVNNNAIVFSSGSSVTMPAVLLAGSDYGVYATYDNKLIATYTNTGSNPMDGYTVPAGYTNTNSRLIGGFYFAHSGSTPLTTISRSRSNNIATLTLSSIGSLTTNDVADITLMTDLTYNTTDASITVSGNTISFVNSGSNESNIADTAGGVWKINNIGSINQYSCWDLKFRPLCSDPRGMVLVDNRFWTDIWLTGNNYINTGTSRKGQRIADGESAASYPLVSTKMGGTGTNTYGNCNWYTATEVVAHWGKKLLSYADFTVAMYGTHEAAAFGTDAQYTCRCSDFTSKWGCEQATGVMFVWGSDLNYRFDHATSLSTTYRSRDSSSVALITASSAHGLSVGDIVTVSGFTGTPGTTYNRSLVTIQSTPSTTTFTYNCVSGSAPEPLTSAAGTVASGLPVFNYLNVAGGRGQIYIQGPQGLVAGLFGGSRYFGANAGSRLSYWYIFVWYSNIDLGLRGCCDHFVVP